MNLKKITLLVLGLIYLSACADYKTTKDDDKVYYSSSGFALIYEDDLYTQKVVNKKIKNDKILVMHSLLKINTPVKIINPDNLKIVKTKIHKKAKYPGIFNVVISKKIASLLDLDSNNPFVEIIEIKKNKTFIAKESDMFEEEKNVAEKAPVDEVKMDDITTNKNKTKKKIFENTNYMILINDFYYEDSAIMMKKRINDELNLNNSKILKISNTNFRVYLGPFKKLKSLKKAFDDITPLNFENIEIIKL